jgi:1,4-dihydroxy-2-naphthoate octaprenyltransferase
VDQLQRRCGVEEAQERAGHAEPEEIPAAQGREADADRDPGGVKPERQQGDRAQREQRGVGEIVVALGFGPIMTLGAYFVQAREYDLEPLLVSIPVGILIALVLYVNEVPDRPADASAGKRTLPVRFSKDVIVNAYAAAVALAFGLIVVFAVAGWIVRPAIIAVAAAPLAVPVYRALKESYEQPYALMPAMAKNIQLHLATGLLLLVGYLTAIVADGALDDPPSFLT